MGEDEMISFKHTQDIANLELRFKELEKKVDEIKANQEVSYGDDPDTSRIDDIKEVLRELFSSNIEGSKRHIKKLRRFSKHMDDWNIYVVEQWKDIRFKKKLLEKLDGDSKVVNKFMRKYGVEWNKLGEADGTDIINGGETPSIHVYPFSSRIKEETPSNEECEHNRPFWECEICGNQRKPKEPPVAGSARQTEGLQRIIAYGVADLPIHYDPEYWKIVEKADLIRWKKEFQKSGNPIWEEFEKYAID